jgi:ABC-type Zn2+ transport system substrate-binding protein/surface adhesin
MSFVFRRVTTINEVLLAIRAVKFHAWEVLFADRISSNRQEELVNNNDNDNDNHNHNHNHNHNNDNDNTNNDNDNHDNDFTPGRFSLRTESPADRIPEPVLVK